MSEKHVFVKAKKYPKDHKLYPLHEAQPGGPLVPMPGGAGFIGWRREQVEKPVTKDGEVVEKVDIIPTDSSGKTFRATRNPVRFRWVYDPTPVKILVHHRNEAVFKALRNGDLDQVDGDEKPKPKKKKKSKKKPEEGKAGG